MTLESCYAHMDGDYADVLRRMGSEERVKRFLLKFTLDPSFGLLCDAMAAQDAAAAFRAAHSLKGISANLGLAKLYRASDVLSEALRGASFDEKGNGPLFHDLETAYSDACALIRQACVQ